MSKVYSTKIKKIGFVLIMILSFVLFLSFIHPTFNIDEEYTVGLIQHSYKQIISINALDVHPPTYYLLLKIFLAITTFWTHSLLIKVLFGHLFSLIPFVIIFIVLYKIVCNAGVKINWGILLVSYLLLGTVCKYATTLRMHEFSALFNILLFYELIKFNKASKTKNIIMATIYAVIATYMDYFSAVCAGVFILIYFVFNLFEHKKKKFIELLFSGIALGILSLPLLKSVVDQTRYRIAFENQPTSISQIINNIFSSFTQLGGIKSIIILVPLIISIVWSLRNMNNSFNRILIISIANYIISNIIALVVCYKINVYEPKFTYPQFSIYSLLMMCIILTAIKLNRHSFIFIFLIGLISISSLAFLYKNVKSYDVPSIRLVKQINIWKRYKSPNITLNYKDVPAYWPESNGGSKQIYITQESTYLNNLHKKLIVKGTSCKNISAIVDGKEHLLNELFNNIKYQK